MGEPQFSGFIAPNLESENPEPLFIVECSYLVRTLAVQIPGLCLLLCWQRVLFVKSGRALPVLS